MRYAKTQEMTDLISQAWSPAVPGSFLTSNSGRSTARIPSNRVRRDPLGTAAPGRPRGQEQLNLGAPEQAVEASPILLPSDMLPALLPHINPPVTRIGKSAQSPSLSQRRLMQPNSGQRAHADKLQPAILSSRPQSIHHP